MPPDKDFIKDIGYLAVASRLKRLTDRLLRSGSQVYKALRLEFEPRGFPLFYLLHSKGAPLSILEAAGLLKISHPAVIQTARMLGRRGLVKSYQDKVDRRRRLLVLTPKGKLQAAALQPVWECFSSAVTEFFQDSRVDMLGDLRRVEDGLDREDIGQRILKKVKARQRLAVEVVDFRPEDRDFFRTLNEEWLKKYFRVEAADRRLLGDPEGEILAKGGFIFFARIQGQVVGTAALLKMDETTYELAKMAVAEPSQRKQAGSMLTEAAIGRARQHRAARILIRTDKCLKAALCLYRKFGFQVSRTTAGGSVFYKREKTATYLTLDLN
jgi:DNA-binding MarR family transcriptional regulator